MDSSAVRIFGGASRLMHSTGVSRQQVRFRQGEQNSAWVAQRRGRRRAWSSASRWRQKGPAWAGPSAPAIGPGRNRCSGRICAPLSTVTSVPMGSCPRRSISRPGRVERKPRSLPHDDETCARAWNRPVPDNSARARAWCASANRDAARHTARHRPWPPASARVG